MIAPRLLLAALLLAPTLAPAQSPAARLAALGEEVVEREFDITPAWETSYQGRGPRAGKAIEDLSPAGEDKRRALYRDVLARLDAIPVSELSETDRTSHTLLRKRAADQLARLEFPLRGVTVLTPTSNPFNSLVRLSSSTQPLSTEADFEVWLARIEASAKIFDDARALAESAAAKGWTTPRSLVEKTLAQIEPAVSKGAYESPFWGVISRYPEQAGDARRHAFRERYRAALDGKLLPAVRRFNAWARKDYLPRARTTSGIGALPNGDRAYRAVIRDYTTLDLTPHELHELGLSEVARIRTQMLDVARGLGFKGEMREFAAWVEGNPTNYPFQSTEDVLAYLRRVHARVEPQLPRLFKRLPRAHFEIHATDPAIAATSAATYSRPSADGLRPGVFHIPVPDARRTTAFTLTSLLLHEGMPGHHLDGGLRVELPLPRFRQIHYVTAYGEGWGLYAESLGNELGVYDDPWALLGRYYGEIHRAARLVVDTGLHWKGWSREQAIRYLVEERGQTPRAATVAIERYMSSPGQALAYKVGELEILGLREEAKKTMGARFDIREFHDVVLREGPLTMELLRARVRAWAAGGGSARTASRRLRDLGEEVTDINYDFIPAFETFTQGAGPRAALPVMDLSAEGEARHLARLREARTRLDAISVADLDASDRAGYSLLRHRIVSGLEGHQHPLRAIQLATPIRNVAGTLVGLGASSQPLRTEADYEAWLARVSATAAQFDNAITALEAAARNGWTAPRSLVDRTVKQLEGISGKRARDGPFWSAVEHYPSAAGPDKRRDFEQRYAAAVDDQLLPALKRFATYLHDRYRPKAKTTSGLGSLPGGDAAYRSLVRMHTTLDLTPEQVHGIGLAEAARIQKELLATARELGFKATMRELSAWLGANAEDHPFRTANEVLEHLRGIQARVLPGMSRLFHKLPRSGFDIRLTPAATAASASASYSRPPDDGSRPGIFFIPVVEPREITRHFLTPVLLHEGMPGHHLDGGLSVELDQPRWRKSGFLTVYGEGWGLYAEGLGRELGVYDDRWALLGRHMLNLRRAGRLVMDTGIHWKGWSREQAIRYFIEECGESERESTIEVERFMSDPGQALAYKIGEREILALREEAKKALGARFDIRDFHDAVLGEGRLTMESLRERVRAWIAQAPK